MTDNPYPWNVAETPSESLDRRLLAALTALLQEDGPVMITSWICIIEYIDATGAAQLASYASEMPTWRITGMISEGQDMLIAEEDEEDD